MGGAADFGLAQYYRTNLANAVAVGAEYAYATGTGVSTTNIQSVIQAAMYLPAGGGHNLTIAFSGVSPGGAEPGMVLHIGIRTNRNVVHARHHLLGRFICRLLHIVPGHLR